MKYWADNGLSNATAYKMAVIQMLKADNTLAEPTFFDLHRHTMGPMPKFDKKGEVIMRGVAAH